MRRQRLVLGLLVGAVLVFPSIATAQGGPFGIGTPEPGGAAWAGPFAPLFGQIVVWQTDFYQRLTDTLSEMKENGGAFWLLGGLAFLYGIFHAAGPGHGKAVISAYLLASGETLKRGVVISFAAAFVQALTAIAVVGLFAAILNVTAPQMTEATNLLEIGSYGLIVLVGVWLLWTRLKPSRHNHAPAPAAAGIDTSARPPMSSSHSHHHHQDDHHETDHHHDHSAAGHHHAPDPALLSGPLTLGSAWTAVLAVGIRPCSGAVIVLVFALAQGLFIAGIGATFAMSLGTAITVSALSALAVAARDFAVRITGGSDRFGVVLRMIEITAALAVTALGLLLLGGALTA